MLAKSLIQGTLLSGLMCKALRDMDIRKLEVCQTMLTRKVLRTIGVFVVNTDSHQLSGKDAQEMLQMASVQSV